jgi:hypothetical protein
MRAFVRSSALAVLASLALAGPAFADTQGLFLPNAPTGPGGEDSIETPGGTRCRQSINSNGAYMDLGVVGNAASSPNSDVPGGSAFYTDERDRQATAYARVTIPLGKKPKRIDCSTVYELEIERLKREVELLRMAAQ